MTPSRPQSGDGAQGSRAGVLPEREESRSGDSGPVAPGPARASQEDVIDLSGVESLLTRMSTMSQADLRRVQAELYSRLPDPQPEPEQSDDDGASGQGAGRQLPAVELPVHQAGGTSSPGDQEVSDLTGNPAAAAASGMTAPRVDQSTSTPSQFSVGKVSPSTPTPTSVSMESSGLQPHEHEQPAPSTRSAGAAEREPSDDKSEGRRGTTPPAAPAPFISSQPLLEDPQSLEEVRTGPPRATAPVSPIIGMEVGASRKGRGDPGSDPGPVGLGLKKPETVAATPRQNQVQPCNALPCTTEALTGTLVAPKEDDDVSCREFKVDKKTIFYRYLKLCPNCMHACHNTCACRACPHK